MNLIKNINIIINDEDDRNEFGTDFSKTKVW